MCILRKIKDMQNNLRCKTAKFNDTRNNMCEPAATRPRMWLPRGLVCLQEAVCWEQSLSVTTSILLCLSHCNLLQTTQTTASDMMTTETTDVCKYSSGMDAVLTIAIGQQIWRTNASIFSCRAKDCGNVSYNTNHNKAAIHVLVSQSWHISAIFVGSCRWISIMAARGDPKAETTSSDHTTSASSPTVIKQVSNFFIDKTVNMRWLYSVYIKNTAQMLKIYTGWSRKKWNINDLLKNSVSDS